MIVSGGCKLELWDDANGLREGANPDLVIDQTDGPTKFVDDMEVSITCFKKRVKLILKISLCIKQFPELKK